MSFIDPLGLQCVQNCDNIVHLQCCNSPFSDWSTLSVLDLVFYEMATQITGWTSNGYQLVTYQNSAGEWVHDEIPTYSPVYGNLWMLDAVGNIGGGGDVANNLEQKQLEALKGCAQSLYNIDLRTFVPAAPGSNGYFYGLTANGSITVETNVTHSSWTLGLMSLNLGPVAGLTYGSTSPNQLNYVASDQLGGVLGIDPTQVHELGHALDYFTSGTSTEGSADKLMNCTINGG
jgi:hypothetical protein